MAKAAHQHRPAGLGCKHKARKHKATVERARGSARDRGYSSEWDSFSKSFIARNPLCEYCLAKGLTVSARVTDHDTPHRGDPELFWVNTFTALCHPCHNSTKARLEARLHGDDLLRAIAKIKHGGRVKA